MIEVLMNTVCDGCGSKIYPGETVFIVERQRFCESCVEVTEFEPGNEYDVQKTSDRCG